MSVLDLTLVKNANNTYSAFFISYTVIIIIMKKSALISRRSGLLPRRFFKFFLLNHNFILITNF